MKANYHTHTKLCNHAFGETEEYVLAAIESGLKELGFSDHAVYIFDDTDHYSHFRMKPHELEGYVADIKALREKYKDKINIFCGMESEYYPKYWDKTLQNFKDKGVEYLILGQHFLGNEIGDFYTYREFEDEQLLSDYCDQCIEAFKLGLFTYITHPDIIRYHGDNTIYEKHITRLCRAAKEYGVPLEINLLGVREGREYPRIHFWEIAAKEGCKAIIGSDAHSPDAVCREEDIKLAKDLYVKPGLILLDEIELRRI